MANHDHPSSYLRTYQWPYGRGFYCCSQFIQRRFLFGVESWWNDDFWMGLVRIAEKSGLVNTFAKAIRPVLVYLFPDVKHHTDVMGDITMNLAANMLGLGNAATPFGIRAMEGLQKLNPSKERATNAMCMLVCINNSSVQLIPFTAMAILAQAGGTHVSDIIITSLLATSASTFAAITLAKLLTAKRARHA